MGLLEAAVPTPLIALEIVSLRASNTMRFTAELYSRSDVAAHFGGERLLMSCCTCRIRIGDRLPGEPSVWLLRIEDGHVCRSIELFCRGASSYDRRGLTTVQSAP